MHPGVIKRPGWMGNAQKLVAECKRPDLLLSRLFPQDAGDRLVDGPHHQRNVSFQNTRLLKRDGPREEPRYFS